jgi:hypothetical protein
VVAAIGDRGQYGRLAPHSRRNHRELLWHYDMTEPVTTVGGGEASGGSMGGPTAAVPLDGKLIVPSGYGMAQYAPGNVVLVFDTK